MVSCKWIIFEGLSGHLMFFSKKRRCGVENIPGPDLVKLEEEFNDHRMALEQGRGGGGGSLNVDDPLSVDIYLHVIAANETSEGGNVP